MCINTLEVKLRHIVFDPWGKNVFYFIIHRKYGKNVKLRNGERFRAG